jgi:BRCT domain type II-containing protein
LFTGFPAAQRAHLEALSDAGGLRVVKTVTQGLVFLCTGPNAGPSKVARARAQHVYIVREPELHGLLQTGELPDYAVDDGL